MPSKNPLVAVWMVTYNHEDYIEKGILSVLNQQTDFQFKLFIGEDCSFDNTRNICIEYSKRFPEKIELLLNDENLGPNFNALNIYRMCLNSGAKYMAMLEGDDYWTDPLKLQKQVDFLEENPDYNICFHPVVIFNEANKSYKEDNITREVLDTTNIKDLARGNYIHTPSVLMRNDFILPDWFTECAIGDWTLYMYTVRDKKIKKLKDPMAVYRVHSDSLWSNKSLINRISGTIQSINILKKNLGLNDDLNSILDDTIGQLEQKMATEITTDKPISFFHKLRKYYSRLLGKSSL